MSSYRRSGLGLAVIASLATAWPTRIAAGQESAATTKLRAQSDQFRKEIVRVTDGVYIAVGYSASNVILVQGKDGVIIIDTATDPVDAREIKAAFSRVSRGPVRAIIYTHSHPDHTGGARVFAGGDNPPIWSSQRFLTAVPDIGRANRDGGDQFGIALPDTQFINAGVQLQFGRKTKPTREGYLPPTRTFTDDRQSLIVAGVHLELIRTPGETADSIAVWLPEKRVLASGDNLLHSFPNVSPIRGSRMRSPEDWIHSLETMAALNADYLLPGHTRPIVGATAVKAALTAYRDALQSILDQTLAGMRKGERPDELVEHVKLAPALAANPYLQEYYGTVEWMVRGIYADRAGWFDGNATNLFPLPEKERAARLLALAGGEAKAVSAATAALSSGDYQWAAELADMILAVETSNQDARRIKAQALTALADRQSNAIARNYYLTVAQRLMQPAAP